MGDHDEKSGKLPSKTFIRNAENNGHDMGYRIALTVEELGSELSAAITKGKPKS